MNDSSTPACLRPLENISTCSAEFQEPTQFGDPISLYGEQMEFDADYATGHSPLHVWRYYNHTCDIPDADGFSHQAWRFDYQQSLDIGATRVVADRADGRELFFQPSASGWAPLYPVPESLQQTASGWVLMDAQGVTESYDGSGRLLALTYHDGQTVTLKYDESGRLSQAMDSQRRSLTFLYTQEIPADERSTLQAIVLPDEQRIGYQFGATYGELNAVIHPDGKTRTYRYQLGGGGGAIKRLIGITDEVGNAYAAFAYTGDLAYETSQAGGVNAWRVSNARSRGAGRIWVTTPLGNSIIYEFGLVNGISRLLRELHSGSSGSTRATYDADGSLTSKTDYNGNITKTTYDANDLLVTKVDASGTSDQRTTHFTWNTALRMPLTRTVLDTNGTTVASASWVYNTAGQPLARCEADPMASSATTYTCGSTSNAPMGVRQWRYTYCNAIDSTQCPLAGLLLGVDGPRTDVSDIVRYSYYLTTDESGCDTVGGACHRAGDLFQVTNAIGHINTYAAYDKNGRVVHQQDNNDVNIDTTYTPRGWLASRDANGAVTAFDYTPYGALASVTDPDGVKISYTYDAAHRLTDITDAQGDRIHYTLDAAGNKTAEQIYDSSGTLRKSLARTFNTRGRLTKVTDGLNRVVFNATYSDSYDANGNLVRTADALGVQRKQAYDGLDRLVSTLDNYNGTDPASKNSQSVFAYDANDRLEGVGDSNGLNTTYNYDGLGHATAVQSPDTGTTAYVYDAAGNVTRRTDAKGVVSTSTYDALSRRTAISYSDSALNVAYGYDEPNSATGCPNSYPVGRLTRLIEATVTTVYCYDQRGNVTRKSQTQGTVTDVTQYGYTLAGRLASTVTPSGSAIEYSRDAAGRISGVTLQPPGTSAGAGNVVTAIRYLPFGPIASYTLGNGQTVTRSYDANYALTDVVSPALDLHFARDAMGNITALNNAIESYLYDSLYRLTSVNDASGKAIEAYTYNRTGDRLSKTSAGLASGTYSYKSGTHWLTGIGNASRTYDANGNTTGSVMGGETYGFGYNGRNRMTIVQRNGSTVGTYTYNALGQRTAKVVTFPQALNQRFAYDENSQLIGEYGDTTRDYIWLDDLPVAVVDKNGTASTVSYVHADGLGTPRTISDSSGATIWSWSYQGNPFGERQPVSVTGFVYNLRFPGQYRDAENGLAYNVNRDFEAAIGRYIQSDPIGLFGGQLSTYVYSSGNPLRRVDPLGLQDGVGDPACDLIGGGVPCKKATEEFCKYGFQKNACCAIAKDGCLGNSDGEPDAMGKCFSDFAMCIGEKPKKFEIPKPKKDPC